MGPTALGNQHNNDVDPSINQTRRAASNPRQSTGVPFKTGIKLMQRKRNHIALILSVAAALCLASTSVFADWDQTNPVDQAAAKWVQLPNITNGGMDVLDTLQNIVPGQWKTLADDFLCTQSGPITDAHIWGSWLGDLLPTNSQGLPDPTALQFHIQFWSDVPQGPTNAFSHPGNLLWTGSFGPGQFTVNPNVLSASETFFDPNQGQNIGTDTHVYQYNFPNLSSALQGYFTQTKGTVYWFEVQASVQNTLGVVPAVFGWKTADPLQLPLTYVPPAQYTFMDDAVFADTAQFADPNTNLPWRDMHYPAGNPFAGASVDLSFVLTSVPEPSSIALAGLGLVALVGTTWRCASKSGRW